MRTNHRAFTLIELLVVVAIIGLLISILIPSLTAARNQAKSCVCLSNLKRLGSATVSYLNEFGDRFPPFRLTFAPPNRSVAYVNKWKRSEPRWQWFLHGDDIGPVIDPRPFGEVIKSKGSFGDKSVGSGGESGLVMTNKYFLCPSLDEEYAKDIRNGSYGYNYQYLGNSREDTRKKQWDNFAVNLSSLPAADGTVLIADSRGAGRIHGNHSYTLDPPRLATERNARKFGPGAGDVPSGLDKESHAYSPVEMRHGKGGNVVFIDGHANRLALHELGYVVTEDGVAVPGAPDRAEFFEATNRLWNGLGRDDEGGPHGSARR